MAGYCRNMGSLCSDWRTSVWRACHRQYREDIGGDILLISASQDEIWPSKQMSERIVARLGERGFRHSVRHLSYETGHGFSQNLAPEVNGKIIEFFKKELQAPTQTDR
jgi:BAAT / Acyl-CoA thioester hydrolase C terminal